MKKFMTSIKTLAILLMAGAALTACSEDINIIDEQPEDPATQKYTMTVKASKDGDVATKALSLDETVTPHKLYATWDADEEVLVYQNGSKIGTLTAAASTDNSTTLSGTLDSAPDASQALTFHFHTAANPSYSGQDGTLTKIASTYDFCAPATVASGSFTVDTENKKVDVSGGISFGANLQAIVKFTFLDKADGTTKLSPSAITASLDLNSKAPAYLPSIISMAGITLPYESNLTIPDATYDENGEGIIYLAIPDKLESLPDYKTYFDFTLTATVGSDTYTLTKSDFPFSNGQYYEITAKMTKLPATGHALSSAVVGDIICSDGLAYAGTAYNNLPDGVTAKAKVCYVSGGHGLALAMADEGNNINWSMAISTCENKTPTVSGCTWKLATKDEWSNMITAAGSYTALRDGFESVGGTNMQRLNYWSSTEESDFYAWTYYFFSGVGGGKWAQCSKADGYYVRAALSF